VTGKEAELLNKKISLLMQDYQIISEIESVRSHHKLLLQDHSKLLAEYKDDPEFLKLKIPVKASYGFDEFEERGYRLFSVKTRLAELEKSRAAAYEDIVKRKKARAVIEEEYQEKTRQQEAFSRGAETTEGNRHTQGELIDLQKQLLNDKKVLADLRLKEAEQRLASIDNQILILRAQYQTLKSDYEQVKRALYVDAEYLRKAESDFERKMHDSSIARENFRQEIRTLNNLKDEIRKKVTESAEKFDLSATELSAFRDWEKTPRSVQEWAALCTLGYSALEEAVIDLDRETKEARIELEKARMRKEEVHVAIIRSWHSLTRRRLGFSSRALDEQIKLFEAPRTEIQTDLALLTEKRTRAIALLQELNAILERIKKLSGALKEKQADFKDASAKYETCAVRMHDAEDQTRRRMYLTAKLIELYSTAIATLEDTTKRIDNVIVELGTKSFWRRSPLSISWSELRNFFPDISRFAEDVMSGLSAYTQSMTLSRALDWFKHYKNPTLFLLLFLRLLMVFLLFWILRTYLPELQAYLAQKPSYFVRSSFRLFVVVILDFINKHLLGLYLWCLLYILTSFEFIGNVYFSLLFYLLSIPYMLYMVHAFIKHFMNANESMQHAFVSQSYQERFLTIVPPLLYATVVLFFFRHAFLVGNYHASAVPAILLAANYIVLQLALMSLISKEWILSLIPRTTPLWEWVYERISQYYYVFWCILIAIIIMSNPYVGYGRQVFFVLSRLVILGLLIPLISYIYSKIRRVSSDLFFYYGEGEVVVERFGAARTWYGFFVIAMFCAFVVLSLVLVAKVINYPLGLKDILSWLNYEIYSPGIDEMGRRLSVTPVTFFHLILFVFGGLAIAYVINRILLQRIFAPLLVSSGVQNAIFTFTRYVIIILGLLIGLKSVGLQSFAVQMVLILGAVGFAVKEPLLDFFSYFIILVQRPIKIGDFIQLDENVTGFVRHITPRSVILRRKNSVTIVVPNSHIITKPVTNWSYSPTFFGLHDVLLTVPYGYEPDKIRAIFLKVLNDNSNILKTPPPIVWLHDFVDNGYQFLIRGYVTADKVHEQWEISSELRLDLIRALRNANIHVATPTRILRVVGEASPEIKGPDSEKNK
jgi:small-conductance mechanosensitive channel